MFKNIKNIECDLNKNFNSLCDWFVENKLSIHFGDDKTKIKSMCKNMNIDTLTASIKPLYVDKNKKYLAFSGIGNNQSFFETLIDNNCTVIKTVEFPDHHFFSENDIN